VRISATVRPHARLFTANASPVATSKHALIHMRYPFKYPKISGNLQVWRF